MKYILVACVLALSITAETVDTSLTGKIRQSLEAVLEQQAKGVDNCENKCDKVFNKFAYAINTKGDPTYEFQACVKGCQQCATDLTAKADKKNCFTTCKNYDWKGNGIVKGVIEPDKACIGGCVINTCQVICAGGTVDPPSAKNKKSFWPNGGCSIKTEPYSQQQDYVSWDSPNSGEGGDDKLAQCCSNALSLCDYVGPPNANFNQLLANTGNYCAQWVPSKTKDDICSYFDKQQNCGSKV
jgi:hypothetical protein